MSFSLTSRTPTFPRLLRRLHVQQLVYDKHGDPNEILKVKTLEISNEPLSNEVLVKWRAAPINPADLNQLQGVYPMTPKLPAVGGNEGCGWVQKVGRSVKNLKVGDLVVPAYSGLGTWCSHGIYKDADLFPIDKDLERNTAAMFQVNPPTAYRLLHDFVELAPGDIVVQNGGNSAVGRYVIQIANILNLNLISVIRARPNTEILKQELIEGLGAQVIYTEEEFLQAAKVLSNVRLALNCIGGRSSLLLARTLASDGVMVTYGGMSKKPVEAPTSALIFKDITLRGFWMSHWYQKGARNVKQRHEMYANLAEWFKTARLKPTVADEHKLEDFPKALAAASVTSNSKQLFVFN